jgi:hypothetical protein
MVRELKEADDYAGIRAYVLQSSAVSPKTILQQRLPLRRFLRRRILITAIERQILMHQSPGE